MNATPNINPENLRVITLEKNAYLHHKTKCYFVLDYLRYGQPGNPEFILTLKNTFNEKDIAALNDAKNRVIEILRRWTPKVMEHAGMSSCTMTCVPRAKALHSYVHTQLFLLHGVSEAARMLRNVEDGVGIIERKSDTKTTHLNASVERVTSNGDRAANTGKSPYPGITRDTCRIDQMSVRGKKIILVDDIYTAGVNIDEDCVQALYDADAAQVVLFALARTVS